MIFEQVAFQCEVCRTCSCTEGGFVSRSATAMTTTTAPPSVSRGDAFCQSCRLDGVQCECLRAPSLVSWSHSQQRWKQATAKTRPWGLRDAGQVASHGARLARRAGDALGKCITKKETRKVSFVDPSLHEHHPSRA
ncbi:unnamed protein product [Lampetra planeri]